MVIEKIKNTVLTKNLIEKNEHIVLGLSGGPDSVCLFHALYSLRVQLGFEITAVHINHKFRPGAAEEDQAYVEELCRKMNVECHVFTYDCSKIAKEQGLTGEEAGRNARYEAFYITAQKLLERNPQLKVKIAVAHNLNDQAETVLFRLMRGTGTDGLSGMEYIRAGNNGVEIIRPLLDTSRQDIEEYCRKHSLNPRIDMTNLEPVYARNKVRLELIPFMEKQFNSNLTEALCRLARIAGEDKAYIWGRVEAELENIRGKEENTFSCQGISGLPAALRHRIIMRIVEEAGLNRDVAATHVEAADQLITEAKTGTGIDLPKGYRICISYGMVNVLKPEPEIGHGREAGKESGDKPRLTVKIAGNDDMPQQKNQAIFDLDKILLEYRVGADQLKLPELRVRKQGDRIGLNGNGSKKLQDIFVDDKVPKEQRDNVLLAALGNDVLWIPGRNVLPVDNASILRGRTNGKYAVSSQTENVLLLEIDRQL